jgi:hypothetical protein
VTFLGRPIFWGSFPETAAIRIVAQSGATNSSQNSKDSALWMAPACIHQDVHGTKLWNSLFERRDANCGIRPVIGAVKRLAS